MRKGLHDSKKSFIFAPANVKTPLMSPVKQYLLTQKEALQKLACLYAYIGGNLSDDDRTQLSVHGSCLLGELPLLSEELIKQELVVHHPATHFGPAQQSIRPRMYGEIMLFALEYIKGFERFLTDVCKSVDKQMTIVCRPYDKEDDSYERWLKRRFVLDFTEDFLVREMKARSFDMVAAEKICSSPSVTIYHFRKA